MRKLHSEVRYLLNRWWMGEMSDAEAVADLHRILRERGETGLVFQNVAEAAWKWASKSQERKQKIRKLLDGVDPRFRGEFEHWKEAMAK